MSHETIEQIKKAEAKVTKHTRKAEKFTLDRVLKDMSQKQWVTSDILKTIEQTANFFMKVEA